MKPDNDIEQLGFELRQLEVERARLEIEQLKKPWYMKPAFLSILIPVLAGVCTAYIGYLGNLDLKRLQADKKKLHSELQVLSNDLDSLRSGMIESATLFVDLNESVLGKGDPTLNLEILLHDPERMKAYMEKGLHYWDTYSNTSIAAIELKMKYGGENEEDRAMLERIKKFRKRFHDMYAETIKEFDQESD